jgi:hypothetical protein
MTPGSHRASVTSQFTMKMAQGPPGQRMQPVVFVPLRPVLLPVVETD